MRMRVYHFDAVRQVQHGLQQIGGEVTARSAREALGLITEKCSGLPGRWTLRWRCGHRWLKSREYNTPEKPASV